jgi:ABC-2 type transport system ATP-binding protein
MLIIEVADLKKKYKQFEALKGISFQVQKNEIFGILGPNGAGKTTTLEIIEGLKKQTSGTCTVLGFDNAKDLFAIKSKIGVQLQSSEYFDFLSLEELLRLFASLYRQKINAREILAKVGLESKIKAKVRELSGGQKQRFTVASALVHKPEILFLDEPTTGLDPQARRSMWLLIKELNSQGITIIMTTHYMEEAEYLCQRIAILDQGKILCIDKPRKLIEDIAKGYKLNFFINKDISADFFDGVKGINKFIKEYPEIIMEIEQPKILAEVIKLLEEKNVGYSFLNLRTATLEDVYLQLTGRQYQD